MKTDSENTNFNLRHLRAVHAIWDEGSFVRAAERLGVVPSALTETVRQIEEIAGAPLFDRRSRPPVPTPLGLSFLKQTAPLLDGLDDSLSALRATARGDRGELRLGATPSAITPLVAPAIAAFRQLHPHVSVVLHDDVAETLAQMVGEGRLDLAIAGRARSSPDLIQTEIACDAFGIACAADHPLTRLGRPVGLADIDARDVVHVSAETGSARLLANAASIPQHLKSGPLTCHSTVAQLCLVRARIGVALLPQNAVTLFNDPKIAFLPLADLSLQRSLYLLTPARRASSVSATRFQEIFAARYG
ncbi:LysR family transcriptional regulator [Salipiger abyssi]|uniref:LysR family transcriptional regulator n=1 Tax=Salipiger abyssi TaxID=1250539 RepID=UPI001A8EDE6A|nr:LysR family transcriptional regulator [Salipiger abyssi]MBN9886925.1 LysR family transcriptional regulator [Salipiger abyssi]